MELSGTGGDRSETGYDGGPKTGSSARCFCRPPRSQVAGGKLDPAQVGRQSALDLVTGTLQAETAIRGFPAEVRTPTRR